MESFKAFDQIEQPDGRNLGFCLKDPRTGEIRPVSLRDIYRAVSKICLVDSVPDELVSQFNVAKNLAVYTWYSYSFHQIAEMKAFSTVEHALKVKLKPKKYIPFRRLIQEAIKLKLIRDRGFKNLQIAKDDDTTEYCSTLLDVMPKLRNGLAHGGEILHPGSTMTLQIAADFINQLFETK